METLLVRNNPRATIYQKIIRLIILSSLFFFSLYIAIYYYTIEQEKEVYKKTLTQFENEVNSLIELNSQTNISNIIDMVYWDEFVSYIKNRDQHWFNENITSSIDTYHADYLGIYDVDGKFISKSANYKIKALPFIPKGVFDELSQKRLLKFYVKIPEGYVEVFGASIHKTQDIYKKVSSPTGYFFIVKLLDDGYFKNLEKLNNSEIDFVTTVPNKSDEHIYVVKNLNDWNGKMMQQMIFKRPFDVSFHITKNILILLIITYFIIVTVYLMSSRRWIYKPLNLITGILEKGREHDMDSVKDIPEEFRYIGRLINENHDQRKLLEISKAKAEESDQLKSSFLTNISHEIRTPMNAIVGFSDLLQSPNLTHKERQDYAHIINKSGINLVSIIDDLIEMSKIDSNQVSPNYSAVDINICIEELYKTIKISIPPQKDFSFYIRTPKVGLTQKVLTDEVKLRQILTNLIANAIKYTETGFVSFGYDVNASTSEIEFTIQDSGIGINPTHHKKIFDRFHRIENDYTIKAGGLGLGLAICKAYVQMLGGHIEIESVEFEGTVITFTIPITIADKDISDKRNGTKNAVATSKGITILVAEDDNINYLLIQKMLNSNQHTVIRAHNGQDAIDICRANDNIDLILMDIKMPVLGGYDAFAEISVFRPYLPVIAQTAYSSQDDERKIMESGFSGYISKPIKKERLFEIINEVVNTKFKKHNE